MQDIFVGYEFQIAASNIDVVHFVVKVQGSGEVRCFVSSAVALQCTHSWTHNTAVRYSGAC